MRQNNKDLKHISDQKFTGSQSSIIYINSIIKACCVERVCFTAIHSVIVNLVYAGWAELDISKHKSSQSHSYLSSINKSAACASIFFHIYISGNKIQKKLVICDKKFRFLNKCHVFDKEYRIKLKAAQNRLIFKSRNAYQDLWRKRQQTLKMWS